MAVREKVIIILYPLSQSSFLACCAARADCGINKFSKAAQVIARLVLNAFLSEVFYSQVTVVGKPPTSPRICSLKS